MRYWAAVLAIVLIIPLLPVAAAQQADSGDLEAIVKTLDSAVVALRKGGGAGSLISNAKSVYAEKFAAVENIDNELHQRILSSFDSVSQSPSEENIFALKRDVIEAAGLLGISVSPLYSYAIFIIAGITFLLSLGITLLNKRVVNWELVNRYRAEVSQFMKEYREILRRQDRKKLHKLEPRLKEIQQKNMVVMTETMKPAFYYFIPLMVLWYLLAGTFRGWVVAWLPFSIPLPIYGQWVACGFGWWYLLTFLMFSTVLRALLLPEASPSPQAEGGEQSAST